MKQHTNTIRRVIPPVIAAGFVLSAGILPAQEPGKGKKPGMAKGERPGLLNGGKAAQPVLPPPFREAFRLPSSQGKVDWPLHAVFGEVEVPGIPGTIDADGKIYVRSYSAPMSLPPAAPRGLKIENGAQEVKGAKENDVQKSIAAPAASKAMIPGPTFVFNPGDLLRLRFHNALNRTLDPALNSFQNNPQEAGPAASDDTEEHVSHEISIPNDSNVTNLHVHGLHVDPKQDDVTLLILPEDNDPGGLSPELQRFVPNINRWWTRNYQYKLPADHLPGSYWYHSHKHGSTSSQVENGMAGTLIIRPKDEQDDPVPGLWASGNDRVMMLQELANFSTGAMLVKQGRGKGQNQAPNLNKPAVTINGSYQPQLKLPPGQVERWRFIVAGANHTTSSYIWAGAIQPQLSLAVLQEVQGITAPLGRGVALKNVAQFNCLPLPGQSKVKLIAVDGITIWQSRDVTPQNPAFGGAGNRLDLLVQVDPAFKADGNTYRIYQNYPVPPAQDLVAALASNPDPNIQKLAYLFDGNDSRSGGPGAVSARVAALGTTAAFTNSAKVPGSQTNPAAGNIPTDPFLLGTNYQGFTPFWVNVDDDGNPIAGSAAQLPVVPLLQGKATPYDGVEIDPGFAQQKFGEGALRWQPLPDAGGGGGVSASILVNLDISGKPEGPQEFPKDLDSWLYAHSPAGSGSALKRVDPTSRQLVPGIPSYVSPIPDDKIKGAQVAVFDRGQFTFSYVDKATQRQIDVRQFWINGRQFNVDDWIGNPYSKELIKQTLGNVEPTLGVYSPAAAANAWTHKSGSGLLVTNPGYFKPVKKLTSTIVNNKAVPLTDANGNTVKEAYNYDYSVAGAPGYKDITGLDNPHTPVSTTAEEWLLVNNSDLFHPFHIHINPFFVTEIGQLHYDATANTWGLKKITLGQKADPSVPFSWVVGNWWDVITIPPHGYVRFRMWINVPTQSPSDHSDPDSDLVVQDNANIYGSWVFHCHILRHEDRGMMLMVNTEPKGVDLDGTWTQDGGTVNFAVEDNHGGLTIKQTGAASPAAFTRGTFNRGIGNALYSQPFLGSMTDASAPAPTVYPPIAFCVINDQSLPVPNRMLLSNGHFLSRSGTPEPAQVPAQTLDLTGVWSDKGNLVQITQKAGAVPPGAAAGTPPPLNLTFTPQTPVWWSSGSGTWNPTGTPVSYTGTQVVVNSAKQNQLLTFCVSLDLKTIVFSNGVTWTRQ